MRDHEAAPKGMAESRSSETIRLLLLALLFLILLLLFTSRFVLVQLFIMRLALPLLVAMATAVAVTMTGRIAVWIFARMQEPRTRDESPGLAACLLVGYPIFGTLCYLVGLITTSRWAMLGVVLPLIAMAPRFLKVELPRERTVTLNLVTVFALAVLSIALLMATLAAQLPASSLDELAYHLAVPKTWVAEGRVVELPLLSHSYFPFGVESADLPALAILGDEGGIASHFLHLFVAMAVVILLYRCLLDRGTNTSLALVCTAALATTPALVVTGGLSWNDWPLLGIVLVLFSALAPSSAPNGRTHQQSLAAVAFGAGLLCKYTFVPIAAVLFVAALFANPSLRGDRRAVRAFLFAGLCGSLFFLRNLIFTGNPVAPFFSRFAPEVSGFRRGSSVLSTLSGYLFDGNFIDESLGLAVVFLPLSLLLLLFASRSDRYERWIVALSVPVVVLLLTLSPSARILVPYLMVLSIIAAGGFGRLMIQHRGALAIFTLGASLCSMTQLYVAAVYTTNLDAMSLLTGRFSDGEYLARYRSSFIQSKGISRMLPADSRTLVIGVQELFFFDTRVRGGGNFDGPRVDDYLGRTSADALKEALHRDGITHIAYVPAGIRGQGEGAAKLQERVTRMSQRSTEILRELLALHADPVGTVEGATLYRVR